MKPIDKILGIIALAVGLTAGCGEKNPAHSGPDRNQSSPATASATPLEEALSQWQTGNHAGAVQRFIEIDWKSAPAIRAGSTLSRKESDLPGMPAPEREKLVADVIAQLNVLRELAGAVRDHGVATAATDQELSRRCWSKLDECGAALDRPEGLKILQLTAQAIRKMAAKEGAKR